MSDKLKHLYLDKNVIEKKLLHVNNKISQIEKAKHNCLNNIKEKKKNDKKNKKHI